MEYNTNVIGEIKQKGFEMRRRVYGTNGLAPTIYTMGGGDTQPKILIAYDKNKTGNTRREY